MIIYYSLMIIDYVKLIIENGLWGMGKFLWVIVYCLFILDNGLSIIYYRLWIID